MTELRSAAALASLAQRVALCLRPLERPDQDHRCDVHCSEPFRAASIIKTGILAALLADVAEGRYGLDDAVEIPPHQVVGGAGVLFELELGRRYTLAELCRLMMVVSDNTASNACLRRVGMERLNDFFVRRGYEASVERFFMSPVEDAKDNVMTAQSAASILADLYRGTGLTTELKDFAVGCLRRQQYREKIPLMLPADLEVGHKTGELEGVRHDAAVVEAETPYILVVLTEGGREPWLVDKAVAECSLEIYERRAELLRGGSR